MSFFSFFPMMNFGGRTFGSDEVWSLFLEMLLFTRIRDFFARKERGR